MPVGIVVSPFIFGTALFSTGEFLFDAGSAYSTWVRGHLANGAAENDDAVITNPGAAFAFGGYTPLADAYALLRRWEQAQGIAPPVSTQQAAPAMEPLSGAAFVESLRMPGPGSPTPA